MTRKWTFMVYMAGDNGKIFKDGMQLMDNLTGYGWDNIKQMASVGSSDDVAIVAQYDTLNANETPRFYIDQSSPTGQVVEKVPPVNTGDPKNLTDFIVWAETQYPAERYALILWNHGSGWKEDDIYALHRKAEEISRRDHQARAVRSRKKMLKRTLFLPTAAEIMSVEDDETRAICYDDTSMDFLDNQDLVKAFADAERQTGQRLAVLGMDACLMSMIEVAYQVREHAGYMIGSQEIEEGPGWPYDKILGALAKSPNLSPLDLSKLIVDEFGKYYLSLSRGGGGANTQSAIDLRAMPQIFAKVQAFAELAAQSYSQDFKTELAITRAWRDVQTFEDTDYADFRHLMQLVRDEYDGALNVASLANDVFEHLACGAPGGPIVANFHGYSRPQANGLSIYFPAKRYSPFYDRQAFTLSGWNHVVRRANGVKAPELTAVGQAKGVTHSADARRVVCPICEGITVVPTNVGEVGETIAAKGLVDLVKQMAAAIQKALASPTTEANQWIDLPCPHCTHWFQYNIKTGETK